jgi:hypothetical protein
LGLQHHWCGGWCIVGGTSEATPVFAGVLNNFGVFPSSSFAALTAPLQRP